MLLIFNTDQQTWHWEENGVVKKIDPVLAISLLMGSGTFMAPGLEGIPQGAVKVEWNNQVFNDVAYAYGWTIISDDGLRVRPPAPRPTF